MCMRRLVPSPTCNSPFTLLAPIFLWRSRNQNGMHKSDTGMQMLWWWWSTGRSDVSRKRRVNRSAAHTSFWFDSHRLSTADKSQCCTVCAALLQPQADPASQTAQALAKRRWAFYSTTTLCRCRGKDPYDFILDILCASHGGIARRTPCGCSWSRMGSVISRHCILCDPCACVVHTHSSFWRTP
jgi:hypothetical protein